MQNERRRILCVIGQLGNGGTERQLHAFLKLLDRSIFEPSVAVSGSSDGIWKGRIAELGVHIHSIEGPSQIAKALSFRKIVKSASPSHIFSWSFFTNPLLLLAPSTPSTGSLRNSLAHSKEALGAIRTRLSLLPKRIVVNSSTLRDELASAGVNPDRIRLVFNIFDKSAMPPGGESVKARLRAEYNIPESAAVVMGAGRNSPTKDFPFFISIVEEALKSGTDLKAVLVGSGGPAMKDAIARRGLSGSFIVTGEIQDARTIMPMADIFMLSSHDEGMPNVLLEAAASGCAPLATDVGGVRDILGDAAVKFGDNTLILRRDAKDAASKLVSLASNPSLRAEVSSLVMKSLESFSPESSMRSYMELFE